MFSAVITSLTEYPSFGSINIISKPALVLV